MRTSKLRYPSMWDMITDDNGKPIDLNIKTFLEKIGLEKGMLVADIGRDNRDLSDWIINVVSEKGSVVKIGKECDGIWKPIETFGKGVKLLDIGYVTENNVDKIGIKFDIICFNLIPFCPELRPYNFIDHLKRLLKPGGKLAIEDLKSQQLYVAPKFND